MSFLRSGSVLLLLATFAVTPASAQSNSSTVRTGISEITKPSRDFLMLQFSYDSWMQVPDTVKIGGFGRGFNAYLCYDFPIQKSHFSFAAGIGIGTSNIYFQDQQLGLTDTGVKGDQVSFQKEGYDYKKYKLATAYLEAPFELRYFGNKDNRNVGFKAAIGLRAGTLVGAHVKSSRTVDGTKVVEKVNTKRYLDKWRFAATARVGWGNVSVFGSYNLNTLFKEGSGPGVVPYSIGICLSGL